MKTLLQNSIAALIISASTASAVTFYVPGTSDLWLAGMPSGSRDATDSAPAQSPVSVAGVPVGGGSIYTFQASGTVTYGQNCPITGPDGDLRWVDHRYNGAANGLSDMTAPWNALVGVFLGPNQPNLNPTPSALVFNTQANVDYLTLSPALQQTFFIGDGLTSLGAIQRVTAPAGATRLFIGTMDGYNWSDNIGSFTVEVVPEPTSASLGLFALSLLSVRYFQSRQASITG
jgi:hypothetical protein